MKLTIEIENWPIRGHFAISRSKIDHVTLCVVTLSHDGYKGRGECRPYARYNETAESVSVQILSIKDDIENSTPEALSQNINQILPAGAARNALDCAIWDLRCKIAGQNIWHILGTPMPSPQMTAYTLSADDPELMAQKACEVPDFTHLKLKVDRSRLNEQITAVAKARPDARYIIDANEALKGEDVFALAHHPMADKIVLIEQPIHNDDVDHYDFSSYHGPQLCADESLHTAQDLTRLKSLGYGAVNIKLDKCGGLTEALSLIKQAREMEFELMAGCMVATSLAIAPFAAIMDQFDYIDLDGGCLLYTSPSPRDA